MKKLLPLLLIAPAFASAANTVKLPAGVVTFAPTKGEVKEAHMTVRCLRSASILEWSNNGGDNWMACKDFVVNGQAYDKYQSYVQVPLKKIGPNQYTMDAVNISYSDSRKGHVCLSVSAPVDGAQVENVYDQWSVLGYCTVAKLPFSVNEYVYNNNRKATLKEFVSTLNSTIVIKTK